MFVFVSNVFVFMFSREKRFLFFLAKGFGVAKVRAAAMERLCASSAEVCTLRIALMMKGLRPCRRSRGNRKKCTKSPSIILPLELIILPEGLLFPASFLEPYMVGYTVPYMEPSISPSAIMEAAEGRLHHGG